MATLRKAIRLREFAVRELVSTEKSYLESLKCLCNNFIDPLLDNGNGDIARVGGGANDSNGKPQPPALELSAQERAFLGTLQLIVPLNVKFLADLERRLEHWDGDTCIGDVFLAFGPFFKM